MRSRDGGVNLNITSLQKSPTSWQQYLMPTHLQLAPQANDQARQLKACSPYAVHLQAFIDYIETLEIKVQDQARKIHELEMKEVDRAIESLEF